MKKKTKKSRKKMYYYYYVFTSTTIQCFPGTLETEIKKFPIHQALKFMIDHYKLHGCISFFAETTKQEYEVFSKYADAEENIESKSVMRRKRVMRNAKKKGN
jgi:hypothetical protein